MKTIKLLSGFALIALLFTSCYTEVIVDDYAYDNYQEPITVNQLLKSADCNVLCHPTNPSIPRLFLLHSR